MGHADAVLAPEHEGVDLVLASGRQHQVYLSHHADGSYRLLPRIWSTVGKTWLPTSLYQQEELDPSTRGCFSCHLSQAHRRVGKTVETAWVELSIDCESCHGPGAEHIRRRKSGGEEVYRNLRGLDKFEDARVCGQCHGFSLRPYVFPRASDGLPQSFPTSLLNGGLRPDGTQRATSYQYPGHVLSVCFREGNLTCSGCHEPHGLSARDFTGQPAVGELSDRQCNICHRDKTAAHTRHKQRLRCVDCHMSYSFIDDDERRQQKTADHSISIPHPAESIALGTPNACTTCHRDRSNDWALQALRKWKVKSEVRRWVETIALARKRAPVADRLAELLDEKSAYLQASALDLLLLQPPDAKLVPKLESFAASGDPQLRAPALRALMAYDPRKWAAVGLGDAHPFVRMEIFSFVKDPSLLTEESLQRDLADTLAYKYPPTDGLVHLITLRHRRGEKKQARELVDLLEQLATPAERAHLDLDGVRKRLR